MKYHALFIGAFSGSAPGPRWGRGLLDRQRRIGGPLVQGAEITSARLTPAFFQAREGVRGACSFETIGENRGGWVRCPFSFYGCAIRPGCRLGLEGAGPAVGFISIGTIQSQTARDSSHLARAEVLAIGRELSPIHSSTSRTFFWQGDCRA